MIYRDDDVPQITSVEDFQRIHNEFIRSDKIHTFSILASQLNQRMDFVEWVLSQPNKDFVLHGWNHVAYAELGDNLIREHIKNSLDSFERYLHVFPTEWHLPWNGWTKELGFGGLPRIKKIAKDFGLLVNGGSEHIGKVVNQNIKAEVVYFHHWDEKDIKLLPKLLEV